MSAIRGQFIDADLETSFREDVHQRMYWLVIGPWLAGAFIVATSILQAYLRVGPSTEWVALVVVRLLLINAVIVLYLVSRRQFSGRNYYWTVGSVFALLVLFNTSAVPFGGAG